MAEHLASIFGTEKDRVNCPFYFKIGACRHGDRCSRLHNRPTASQTLLLANMYQSPDAGFHGGVDQHGNIQQSDPRKLQEHFEDFYEDIFEELSKYGEIENLNVCDNLADHMIGNVYVKFREEEHAAAALNALNGRFYAGRPIIVDFSPVTDFREATCRQYEENTCNRGGYCNFMHLKKISRELRRKLFGSYRRRSRSRSHSPYGRGITSNQGGVAEVVAGEAVVVSVADSTEIGMTVGMMIDEEEEGIGAEVEVLVKEGKGVLFERGVRNAVPRLNSGIGRGKKGKLPRLQRRRRRRLTGRLLLTMISSSGHMCVQRRMDFASSGRWMAKRSFPAVLTKSLSLCAGSGAGSLMQVSLVDIPFGLTGEGDEQDMQMRQTKAQVHTGLPWMN
ncbi:hypothetical protein R1sor_024926 [Riccia sorocarpa]|uniref:Splicing factor U2af 38 kDa subunit n=1 Tax=Riccia sorocarpa TaxID=122646 RepID=A0ABD3GV26_9MARC